ncbi:VgrG protein [Pseudomonas sp. R3-18-08]|nr:VgrG protein [Pseudomonas sp. R3-18-08]
MRKKIVFRPQLTTPRPTISGPQTAIIVGPPGEEILTDELGSLSGVTVDMTGSTKVNLN